MFQMTPYQSWSTFIVAMLFVAAFVWLMVELQKHSAKQRANAETKARRAQFAIVPELPRESTSERHLTLVTDINSRKPEPAPYDWQKQGI
jgi:Na+/H+ antiporter NhaC